MKTKILFILKRRQDIDNKKYNPLGLSTGLYNSAKFMADMLQENNINSALEIAIDNNCIDRLVTLHKPTHVIIEALWVVPSKFIILSKLHPTVKWIIRLHSEIPFMASEGMSLDWIGDYSSFENIYIGVNSPRMLNEISTYIQIKTKWSELFTKERIFYLPNFYPQNYVKKEYQVNKECINIGCFGAIRPLKNHVMQALAAIKLAERIGKTLLFHINAGRTETKGEPVLNNLRGLFHQLYDRGHKLIEHEWTEREEFIQLCAKMDIGMQVSFSETFNIVGADIISQGVPLVGSAEIPWLDKAYSANAQHFEEIFQALMIANLQPQHNVHYNQKGLKKYTDYSKNIWLERFNKE